MVREMWNDACRLVAKRRKLGEGPHRELVAAAVSRCDTAGEVLGIISELVAARLSFDWSAPYGAGNMGKDEKAFWEAFKIDRSALVKAAEADAKEAKAAKQKPAKKAKPAKVRS
jgi:hypothetical protein